MNTRMDEIWHLIVHGNTLFAVNHDGHVFRSPDSGITWTSINFGKTYDINCMSSDGTNLYAGASTEGIIRSTDNGATWAQINAGLPTLCSIKTIKFSGENIYVSIGRYCRMYDGIFVSKDKGNNWTQCNNCISMDQDSLQAVEALIVSNYSENATLTDQQLIERDQKRIAHVKQKEEIDQLLKVAKQVGELNERLMELPNYISRMNIQDQVERISAETGKLKTAIIAINPTYERSKTVKTELVTLLDCNLNASAALLGVAKMNAFAFPGPMIVRMNDEYIHKFKQNIQSFKNARTNFESYVGDRLTNTSFKQDTAKADV